MVLDFHRLTDWRRWPVHAKGAVRMDLGGGVPVKVDGPGGKLQVRPPEGFWCAPGSSDGFAKHAKCSNGSNEPVCGACNDGVVFVCSRRAIGS